MQHINNNLESYISKGISPNLDENAAKLNCNCLCYSNRIELINMIKLINLIKIDYIDIQRYRNLICN